MLIVLLSTAKNFRGLVLLFSGIPLCSTGSSLGPIATFLVVWLFQSVSIFFSYCFLIGGSVFVLVMYKLCSEQLKSSSCPEWLLTLFTPRKAFQALSRNPNLIILGDDMARRLPIFSLLVNHEDSGKIVHHNFLSVLLNDLYGIQARGGCACAGPYAQVGNSAFISVPKREISAKSQNLVYLGVSDAWNLTTRK